MSELSGPRALPIIGNLHKLKKPPCVTFSDFASTHGEVYLLKLGSAKHVILNSVESIQQAFDVQGDDFSDRASKFTSFVLYKEVRGQEHAGLTVRSASSDIWHVQHSVVRRAMRYFVFDREDNRFEKAILSEASKLVSSWLGNDKEPGASCVMDPIDSLEKTVNTLKAVYILGNAREGIKHFDERLEAYTKATVGMLAEMRSGFVNDFLPVLKFATKSKQNKLRHMLSVGADFFNDIYKAHEASYHDGSKETIMDCFATFHDEVEKEEPGRPTISRKSVFGVIPELFEGGANNSDSLFQIILYMANFPEIQEKVRQELREVVGTKRHPSLLDRERLPLTEAVMYEVWRHSSFVNITVPHIACQDTVLGGRFNVMIPKGTAVIGNLYAMQRDPKVWDKPEAFNPSRFLSEAGALDEDKVKQAMIFSTGKRSCIAEMMVRRELFLLYGVLIQLCKFENEGPPLTKQKVGGFSVPRDGSLEIRVTRTPLDVTSGTI